MQLFYFLLIFVSLFVSPNLSAQAQAQNQPSQVQSSPQVVNEVLFELNDEVWTSFDFQQFLKAKNKVPLTVNFLKQPQSDLELFTLTRVLYYQIITTNMTSIESQHNSALKRYQSQNDSLNAEIERLKMIVGAESGSARFQQLATAERYNLWFNYMKKKYNYSAQ